MRVVIVTGTALHHKNLCVKLAQAHHVVGIIHPEERSNRTGMLQKIRHHVRKKEVSLALLHGLRKVFGVNDYSPKIGGSQSQSSVFQDTEQHYLRLPKSLIHNSCDVNSAETHTLVRSLQPDV